MVWLSILSLAAGAVLAQHFKVIILVPATGLIILLAIADGLMWTQGSLATLLIIALASAGIQTGYLIGLSLQSAYEVFSMRRSSTFTERTPTRGPVR
jgi:hypothetical protein